MLSDIDFNIVYTSGEDEPADFFLNALMNSSKFDLGLGFFHSSGFRALALGFAYFITKGGTMRMIINDELSPEDKQAIKDGVYSKADELIEKRLVDSVDSIFRTLSSHEEHFFRCLSWLIASKKLDVIAITSVEDRGGLAHQKFGVFTDNNNNKVAFNGSANFSKSALLHNLETISCYPSWVGQLNDTKRIEYYETLFLNLWGGKSKVARIIPIENVKTKIKEKFKSDSLKDLITAERLLLHKYTSHQDIEAKYNDLMNGQNITSPEFRREELPVVSIPITLRPYQEEAIQSWFNNDNIGLFAMATGTGKTITSLAASVRLMNERDKSILLITVPFLHLAEQWLEESIKFGLRPILVGESKQRWVDDLAQELNRYKRSIIKSLAIISVNNSLRSDHFKNLMESYWEDCIFIADECHYLGSRELLHSLPARTRIRLGLSATPTRHYDEEGSNAILAYFNKIVYELSLEKAIGEFLTPYYYYPIPVELLEEEFEEYKIYTSKIEKLARINTEDAREKMERLAIQRARVQNNSRSKLTWLDQNITNTKDINYSLFYTGDLVFDDVKRILGFDKLIKIHEFTGEQTRKERKLLLDKFSRGELQALIAMKCLDEGVDVPPTRTAYFLASSGNPREFIQRRGRVLRKYPGKEYATIYDLISIPPIKYIEDLSYGSNDSIKAIKSAFKKEYKRMKEFAKLSINSGTSLNELFPIANKLDLIGV